MEYIFFFLVYGVVLTGVLGLLASWIDRKVTARVQYRSGPPLLQPFWDIAKLLGKRTLVPEGVFRSVFLLAPAAGLAGAALASTLLWAAAFQPNRGFQGDLIAVLCLFTIPSISTMAGGFASRNPLARVGASREMKLLLSYALPLALAALAAVIKAGFALRLGEILAFQARNGVIAGSLSGVLALAAAVPCAQAVLGLVPFDLSEAETEISSGTMIEYSGVLLALFRLMKNMLLFSFPFFLIVLFMGGIRLDGIHLLLGVLKYVGLLALLTVIRNTNPRLRIDQALKFFRGPVTVLAALAVILALLGL
jgi:NADH-quinone oxidoreductase subunit H